MIPALATGRSFSWLLCLCDIPPSLWVCFFVLDTFLLSGTTRGFRLILYMYFPSLRLSRFSEEHWFLLQKNDIRNQDLSAKQCDFFLKFGAVHSVAHPRMWPGIFRMLQWQLMIWIVLTGGRIHTKIEKTMEVPVPWTPAGTAVLQLLSHSCLTQSPAPLHCPEAAAPA